MTCEEFRTITDRDPFSTTNAEAYTFVKHAMGCEPCDQWLRSTAIECAQKLDPKRLAEIAAMSIIKAIKIANDAECNY